MSEEIVIHNFNDPELNKRMENYERLPIGDYERAVITGVVSKLNQKREKYGQPPKLFDEEKLFLINSHDIEGLKTGNEIDDCITAGFAQPIDGKIYVAMKDFYPIDFLHFMAHEVSHVWGHDSLRVMFGRSEDEALTEKIAIEVATDVLKSGILFEYFDTEIDDDIICQLVEEISAISYVDERGRFDKMIDEEVKRGYYTDPAHAIEHYEELYFHNISKC